MIHNTGKIQTETTYQNGTKNGSYVKYYKTGKLQETGNYQNGKKQGEKQHQEIREKLISRYRPDNTPSNVRKINKRYRLKVIVNNEPFYFDAPYSTRNFVNNILACITVLSVLNLNLNKYNSLAVLPHHCQLITKIASRYEVT